MTAQLVLGQPADTARISPCEAYRYELTRELGGTRTLVAMGLNPSTATAIKNDQTILKDIGFARRWGFGRIVKLNAYAYRARDPKAMKRARRDGIDVVGPDNDRTILEHVARVRAGLATMFVSWGANIDPQRQRQVAELLSGIDAWCLGTNDDGSPEHELFIPYERPLARWTCP